MSTTFFKYAAQKAERVGDYKDAASLYEYAAREAEDDEERMIHFESHFRCALLDHNTLSSGQTITTIDAGGLTDEDK